MPTQSLYRFGGLAAMTGLALSFGAYAMNAFLVAGVLVLVIFLFALHRWLGAHAPGLSLAALVAGIGGALVIAVTVLLSGSEIGVLVALSAFAVYFLPALVFGFIAYRHRADGLPRALAVCGLVGGSFGLVNILLVIVAGGDYANPTVPALAPFINATYLAGTLPTFAWIAWSGIVLLRASAAPIPQPA